MEDPKAYIAVRSCYEESLEAGIGRTHPWTPGSHRAATRDRTLLKNTLTWKDASHLVALCKLSSVIAETRLERVKGPILIFDASAPFTVRLSQHFRLCFPGSHPHLSDDQDTPTP